jgi:hypothetical protein
MNEVESEAWLHLAHEDFEYCNYIQHPNFLVCSPCPQRNPSGFRSAPLAALIANTGDKTDSLWIDAKEHEIKL